MIAAGSPGRTVSLLLQDHPFAIDIFNLDLYANLFINEKKLRAFYIKANR